MDIDPETEAVVTIGAKEGLSHLVLVLMSPGDVVFAPNPTYPIHPYSAIIAGGDVRAIPIGPDRNFLEDLRARDQADLAAAQAAGHLVSAQSDDQPWWIWTSFEKLWILPRRTRSW